jgi:hypothetical protein
VGSKLPAKQGAVLCCLAVAIAASAALLLGMDSHLTFIADDWELLVGRRGSGPDAFLAPFNGNIVLGPALIYRLLQTWFGIDSALPFYAFSVPLSLACGGLLFVCLRRRVDAWLALLGAISLLFLGAAYEDFLWAFQMGYFGSMATGLGMLVALARGDRRGDRIACALLVVSVAFSSIGIAFAAGALAEVAIGRPYRPRRLYIGLVPLALFLLWWVGWGHTAQTYVSLSNVEHLPGYVFESAAAGITSLLGLASDDGSQVRQPYLIWGKLLLVLALVLVTLRVAYERRISKGLAVMLVIGLTFWVLAGLNRNAERFPTSSRYQYPSAVFLLLVAAEAASGLRLPRLVPAVATLVVGFAVWGGISVMYLKYSDHWRPLSNSIRSSLTAVEIAGTSAKRGFRVKFPPSVTLSTGSYLSTVREDGTPAFTESELEARQEAERIVADTTLAEALGLSFKPLQGSESPARCQSLRATPAGTTGVTFSRRDAILISDAGRPIEILLHRFAATPSVRLGTLPAGETVALTIPDDSSDRAWRVGLKGWGAVRLCATKSAA